jgi:predicted Rossmann fold nucleotide-binding protein DprA/Smf involved in DNA uptake
MIFYPKYSLLGSGATFARNRHIVENSDLVLIFYAKGQFQQGGSANTASCARKLGVTLREYEEE